MVILRLVALRRVALVAMAVGFCSVRGAAHATPVAAAITCVGRCGATQNVLLTDLLTLVNIALGNVGVAACPVGIPTGALVTIALILEAINTADQACPTPAATATATIPVTMTVTPTQTADPTSVPTSTETMTASVSPTPATPTQTAIPTAITRFCDLPGSVRTTATGFVIVPGGAPHTPDLRFLHVPVGFCTHFYANVGNTRQLRFAAGGELFVASPTTFTSGGGSGGAAAIVVLPDDDHDGVADTPTTFLSGLPSTQGLLFANGFLYYQDGTKIMRTPYLPGDRTASGSSEQVADISIYVSSLHWPKTLDIADDGIIYVANAGDQFESCEPVHAFHGGILKLDGSPGGAPVAQGFRNPISLRCARGHNLCFAIELARDLTATQGGREKVVPIRQGDDWGFPCCASKDQPFTDISPVPDCSAVASEDASFVVGDTPFDLDFETGKWPPPWNNRVYVPLHGKVAVWKGARLVAIALDPITGQLLPGSDRGGGSSGAFADFATGWDDNTRRHGRPANVAFAGDGRLFLGNDNDGNIIWIAPLDLPINTASPQ